jgi:hypothetical protein
VDHTGATETLQQLQSRTVADEKIARDTILGGNI